MLGAAAEPPNTPRSVLAYVDDLLTIDTSPAVPALSRLYHILREVGFEVSAKKLAEAGPPGPTKKWIGVLWDAASMTWAIPPDKVEDTRLLARRCVRAQDP